MSKWIMNKNEIRNEQVNYEQRRLLHRYQNKSNFLKRHESTFSIVIVLPYNLIEPSVSPNEFLLMQR